MLKLFKGTYVGFTKSQRIGEIFEYEGDKWVVIKILNPKFRMYGNPRMEVEVVAQKVGIPIDYGRNYEEQTITDRIRIEGKKPWEIQLRNVGELVTLSDESRGIKLLSMVIGIDNFEYEFVDLIVDYRVQLIKPWSQREIDKVVHENRLSTFKVIPGKKKKEGEKE